jgi:hypothetical protein
VGNYNTSFFDRESEQTRLMFGEFTSGYLFFLALDFLLPVDLWFFLLPTLSYFSTNVVDLDQVVDPDNE